MMKEVTEVANVITGAVDEDGVPTPQAEDDRKLRKDYARLVWSKESQLVSYKADMKADKEPTKSLRRVQILEDGALYFKTLQKERDKVDEQLQLLSGAVLELGWSHEKDKFVIQLATNVSTRKGKQPTGEEMIMKDIYKLEEVKLSKRICMSVVISFQDPMGMFPQPTGIILKVMFRRLFSKDYNLDWVEDLVKDLHGQRMDVIKMLVGKVLKLDSKGASKMGIPDMITSSGKNVEKEFYLFYSLVRRARSKFDLGSYVARELYEGN